MARKGWTFETLKAHFDALRKDDQRAIREALAAAEKAVTKAEVATEKRFDAVNEFRGALSDQAQATEVAQAKFLPRTEYETAQTSTATAIADLRTRLEKAEGRREGVGGTGATALSVISAVGMLVAIAIGLIALFGNHGSQPVVQVTPTPGTGVPVAIKP